VLDRVRTTRSVVALFLFFATLTGCGSHSARVVPSKSGAAETRAPKTVAIGSPCVANAGDVTGQTVDCYADYGTTFTQQWNLTGNPEPVDLDDPGGADPGGNGLICGPMTTSFAAQGGNVSVVASPAHGTPLPPCPDKADRRPATRQRW
jgi:hypothetical protein